MANGNETRTMPRWSAGIGTKYDTQARKELAMGNVNPRLPWEGNRAYTASEYYAVLDRMKELSPELAAYQEAIGGREEAMGAYQSKYRQLRARIGELSELKRSYFYRDIDWVTRWLMDDEIKRLQTQLAGIEPPAGLEAPAIGPVFGEEYMGEIYERGAGPEVKYAPMVTAIPREPYGPMVTAIPREEERVTYGAPGRLPIPSWLGEFLETSMGPAGEAGRARGAYALRPMGAQAELGTEKLGKMAGYLGWGKAGAPLKFEESYLQALEQLPGWWEEYTALSEKLFPKAVSMPKPTWRATYQR